MTVNSHLSKSGNQFIDVLMKTTETENAIIRIMKNSNSNISIGLPTGYKSSVQPVEFSNLSPSSTSGTFFFNSFRGSKICSSSQVSFSYDSSAITSLKEIMRQNMGTYDVVGSLKWLKESVMVTTSNGELPLREAVLYDGSGDMKLTVWNDFIDSVNEATQYSITNLSLKNFYGQKLSTTKMTTFSVTDSNDASPVLSPDRYQSYLSDEITTNVVNKLCCPEVVNLELELYPGCTNINCQKSLVLQPGIKIVTCPHCKHTMRCDRCSCVFDCKICFKEKTLVLPREVLESFLKLDVIQMGKDNMDELKEKLLFLENVDYDYNNKNIITSISEH